MDSQTERRRGRQARTHTHARTHARTHTRTHAHTHTHRRTDGHIKKHDSGVKAGAIKPSEG